MQHLWPRRPHLPPKLDLNPLHEMTSDLDLAHVCRVPLRRNIIMLQDACRVEIVHEFDFLVMLVHGFDLVDVKRSLSVCVSDLAESAP